MTKLKKNHVQRRQLLKTVALTPLGLMGFPLLSKAAPDSNKPSTAPETTILFQGDSITDAGRDRSGYYANNSRGMGGGYVRLIVAELLGDHSENEFRCYNRGISGNKVHQLADRWEDDCLQLRPQVLSILIGVNDFWHTLNSGYEGTPELFDSDLRALLNRTRKEIPGIKLIMGEPFAVKGGSAITEEWKQGFVPYQHMVKEITADFDAALVPYQQVFDQALEKAPVSYWCPDGVHPSLAGAYLMKEAWLQEFHKIM